MTVHFKNVPIPTFMLSKAESKIAFISRTGKVPVKCLLFIKTSLRPHCHHPNETLGYFYLFNSFHCWIKHHEMKSVLVVKQLKNENWAVYPDKPARLVVIYSKQKESGDTVFRLKSLSSRRKMNLLQDFQT